MKQRRGVVPAAPPAHRSFFWYDDVIAWAYLSPAWCQMIVRALPILLAGLAGATWTDAETVNVQYGRAVDLAPYACQDITRSSVVNRVCYDAASRRMIVQAHTAWSQYCDVPEAVRDSFLNAPSMGQFYNANITGSETASPYECRAPVIGGRSVYQDAIPPQYRKRAGERPARLQ